MYEKFFSLDELPFDGLPDNRFYYVGNYQHQALDILTTNLSRNGSICVLSGPSGSGKTTTVRMLIRSLPKRMRIIAIDDPRLDPHMLLATILRASGVVATSFESIAELTLKLRKLLEHSIESGIITTVICDEAQGLSDEVAPGRRPCPCPPRRTARSRRTRSARRPTFCGFLTADFCSPAPPASPPSASASS